MNHIIAGIQGEHFEALSDRRLYKAAWVLVRWYWGFVKAVGFYSGVKTVLEAWHKVSAG